MSRIPKWRIEKIKVKVVFRLQFHATNIPPTGWDKLFLSFISADTGKATTKTNKANVRNGSCKWSEPIYEATRLIQDSRTKKYDDKLCKLVVAMGSSRSTILGEVDVNLAEFADALKPASVALPLRGCDYGTVLHVTVQLLTPKTGFREFEQQRETGVRSPQILASQRSPNPSEFVATSSDTSVDKVNVMVGLNENSLELPSVEERAESTEDYENSSHASDGLFAENNDLSGGHEISIFRRTSSGELLAFPTGQSPRPAKEDHRGNRLSTQGSNDWTHGWSSEHSADNDLAAAYEENSRLRIRLEVAESAFSQLKSEAKSLQCITDELGAETHGLSQQLAGELASGRQLTAEVSILRTECSSLKRELEEIKSAKLLQPTADGEVSLMATPGPVNNTLSKFGHDFRATDNSVFDLQSKCLHGLLLLESKLQEAQNNVFRGLHGGDLDFLLAELEGLQCIVENLKQGVCFGQNGETHYLEHVVQSSSIAHQPSLSHDRESLKKNSGAVGTMEEKICQLLQKLDDSKTEKENLMEKMNQMQRYYEAYIHKLDESQKQTLKELENLRNEHDSCFYTVSVLQAQKQKIHEEMNEQLMSFVEIRTALESQNKELERRAVASETALKKVRWNYSASVGRLQKDLELLSFQVLSMYESNETLAKQAFVDVSENYPEEKSAEAGLCSNKEHGQYKPDVKQIGPQSLCAATESREFLAENGVMDNPSYKMDGQIYHLQTPKNEELLKMSRFQLLSNAEAQVIDSKLDTLKEVCSTMEAELLEMYVTNIEWKVFSDTLRESHYNAVDRIKHMQDRIYELEQLLHDSNDVRESLVLKLNSALDQAESLKGNEARCISKYDDLAVKNQILEAKVQDISVENALFMEKLAYYERIFEEHRSCESKYKSCVEERSRFENLLVQESLQKSELKNEIGSVLEDFKALKEEFDKQCSTNNDLQRVSAYLQERLGNLCSDIVSCSKQMNISAFDDASLLQELESMNYTAVVTSLELFQQQACQKVLQLRQEKEALEETNNDLQNKSEKSESEMLDMKKKFQSELDSTTAKLNTCSGLIEDLQQELQDMTQKFKLSSEAQEKHSVTNSDLSSRLSQLEVELQRITNENEDLVQKLHESSAIVEELEKTKVSLAGYEEDNRTLMMSMQSKADLLMEMENEVRGLQEGLIFANESLITEKRLREELECTMANLWSQIHEKDKHLHSFDENKIELAHLRCHVLDLEKAYSTMQNALLRSEESQRELESNNHSLHFQLSNVEHQLAPVLEDMLASEIEASCMRSQVGEVAVQLDLFRKDLEDLHLKHKSADALLRAHMSKEAELADRNAMLEVAVHSLEVDHEKVMQEKAGLEERIKIIGEALAEASSIESRDVTALTQNNEEIQKYEDEILQLKVLLTSLEKQVDDLMSTKDELEILTVILKSKLEEQHAEISLLRESEHESTNLREQHKELTQKLAEQILKTEEFKNLSIHLRELKEKAEVGRKENESSLFAMQESLRIAFIREQYESKFQELKSQVFVSKKYAEEMLFKLQNALDEAETGKKNEIALAKRIEALSMKISEMEVELRDVSAEKRELSNAYDSIKTELECTALSFDCCKEEKQKVEAFLQECNEERNRIKAELDLVKRLLENMVLTESTKSREINGSCIHDVISIRQILGDTNSGCATKATSTAMEVNLGKEDSDNLQSTDFSLILSREGDDVEKHCSDQHGYVNSKSGSKAPENCCEEPEREVSLENHSTENNIKEPSKEHQQLAIDLNLFRKELERLKDENMSFLLPLGVNLTDPSFHGLERALSQLDMATEHLQRIFPSFKELSGSGNALERVLALELELAEALQAKKKTDILFQSSFLKQHNDEAAVFQSFRDINELIQDMIELKRRHAAVETELKEMEGRYSELSVQFAEVEGERQKLAMTLKNRSPRRSQ